MDASQRPQLEKQKVDINYLLKEAPREQHFITGAQAMAEAVKRANVDMAIAYPITPQSEVMHLVGDIYAQGHIKEYYRAEEELGTQANQLSEEYDRIIEDAVLFKAIDNGPDGIVQPAKLKAARRRFDPAPRELADPDTR